VMARHHGVVHVHGYTMRARRMMAPFSRVRERASE
jgi:hypothetical protein